MNPYIKNPKILLLKCSIEYLYREETKFTCIDPIVLQVRTLDNQTGEEASRLPSQLRASTLSFRSESF